MPAGVTPIEMAPERGGPTARDRAQNRSLLHAQPRMLLDEGVTLRVEDIGHLHGGPAHGCGGSATAATGGGPRARAPAVAPADSARLAGDVATDGDRPSCAKVGVAQQELDRPQVGARFQQMRRVAVAQRVRRHVLVDPGLARGQMHSLPDHFRRDGRVGAPAMVRPRGRDRSAVASSGSTRAAR